MNTKPNKKHQESESLKEQIIKLEKQLESFKHSNDHFLKNKLFLHYDIKEPEKVVVDCETKLPVLAEIDKKKIQKGKETDPTHLIIEGDNYHALSVLNYTHAGKIDLIYIDPPYNTGNKDFIYNDRFVDREDSFRHSKWLSFMAHRLRLAKSLLSDTGVIFISIDDNEQAHLRLLCDQIFGEEHFINNFMWLHGKGKKNKQSRTLQQYILAYGKKPRDEMPVWTMMKLAQGTFTNPDNDSRGNWFSGSVSFSEDRSSRNHRNYFSITSPSGIVWTRQWMCSQEEMDDYLADNKIYFGQAPEYSNTPRLKIFPDDTNEVIPDNILDDCGTTRSAQKDLDKMIGLKRNEKGKMVSKFENPKPPELIEHLIVISTQNKSATVLDFFAGSGTTGHAVMELNTQDSGTRQFILCSTNDEKEPIVDTVLYPRIKKVIDGYGDNAPIPANFRYFQTDFVEKKGSASQLKIDLTRQCAEMLCVKENVFETVKLKKQAKNYKLFKNGDKYLGVFFDFFTDAEFTGFIKELDALPKEAKKAVYVFVLDGSASILADEFAGVTNCEVKEIPQKILDIYKQLAREVARK